MAMHKQSNPNGRALLLYLLFMYLQVAVALPESTMLSLSAASSGGPSLGFVSRPQAAFLPRLKSLMTVSRLSIDQPQPSSICFTMRRYAQNDGSIPSDSPSLSDLIDLLHDVRYVLRGRLYESSSFEPESDYLPLAPYEDAIQENRMRNILLRAYLGGPELAKRFAENVSEIKTKILVVGNKLAQNHKDNCLAEGAQILASYMDEVQNMLNNIAPDTTDPRPSHQLRSIQIHLTKDLKSRGALLPTRIFMKYFSEQECATYRLVLAWLAIVYFDLIQNEDKL